MRKSELIKILEEIPENKEILLRIFACDHAGNIDMHNTVDLHVHEIGRCIVIDGKTTMWMRFMEDY